MCSSETSRIFVRGTQRNSSSCSGNEMDHFSLNLNEPPMEDDLGRYVMLTKDRKPICRTKCHSLPLEVEVPAHWSICEIIRRTTKLPPSGMCQFFLYPDPVDLHQQEEWPKFTGFLKKHNKVAIVKSGSSEFYILPPDSGASNSLAVVVCRKQVASVPDQAPMEPKILAPSREVTVSNNNMTEEFGDSSEANVGVRATNPEKHLPYFKFQGILRDHDSCESIEEACCRSQSMALKHEDHLEKSFVCVKERDSKIHMEKHPPDIKFPHGVGDHYARESVKAAHCRSQPVSLKRDDYQLGKNFVRTDPSYLRTLGQAHSGWIFGAIAELVDNSRDAKSTKLEISIEKVYSKIAGKEIPMMSVIDDGHGMSHQEIVRMVSFGHKQPDGDDPDRIGRFGIGFKTGAMRLGRDAIVLTQTTNSRSIAFLSQSLNEGKDNLEIPIVSYCRQGQIMEKDTSAQSKELADYNLKCIKEFSPFNKYFIGVKSGLFSEKGTGTQIYIWNLDEWGSDYCLEWQSDNCELGDILIRSRRIRSRPGQISRKVPLDYSLRSYLEVIFLDPRMKIFVQGSPVKTRPLAKSLNKTLVIKGDILGKPVKLTLGRSQLEWEQVNCGIFLYWHGRLIEAYKRVGGMVHNADMGRGVIGVVDVTNVMNDGNGRVWVHSNKQGFQDCEPYAKLEEWLGNRSDEYWDANFDTLELKKGNAHYKPDHEWVQCDKCRKWRILSSGFDSNSLPQQWFCYMPPFKGKCEIPEQQIKPGVITVVAKRSGYDSREALLKANSKKTMEDSEDDSSQVVEEVIHPSVLKRLRRGPARDCKKG